MFHHHVKCPTSPRLTALTDPYFSVTLGRKVIESGFYVQGGKSYIHKDSRNKRKQLIWVLKKKTQQVKSGVFLIEKYQKQICSLY